MQACFQLGIDPVDLQFHPLSFYKHREDADEDVTKLRYERYEAVRQVRARVAHTVRACVAGLGSGRRQWDVRCVGGGGRHILPAKLAASLKRRGVGHILQAPKLQGRVDGLRHPLSSMHKMRP